MTPTELCARLDAVGWFNELPREERTRILESSSGHELSDPEVVAKVVARVVVDPEGVTDPESYRSFIAEVSEQIPFAFKPDVIEVTESAEDEGELTIKLALGDRAYTCVFDQDGDFAQSCVLEFIEGILEDTGSKLRLFGLPVSDGCAHLAVTTPEAYERAIAEGILPELDAEPDEDDGPFDA